MDPADVQKTLDAIRKSQQDPVQKAWTQSSSAISGLTQYDLEAPAKTLYPVITPLRNAIPRVSGKGGIQANWRAITKVNTQNANLGLGEGNRGAVIAEATADYTASYKGYGLDNNVTYEADFAAEGFDDVRARAVEGLLRSQMIGEEKIILGGNSTLALGQTPQPTLTTAGAGGSIVDAAAFSVICVALTFEGYLTATVDANGVKGYSTKTNADGSTDNYGGGSAQPSANRTIQTAGSPTADKSTVSASVTAVKGAFAYAWYWGQTATTERIGAITTTNSVLITGPSVGTYQLASAIANNSGNNYDNSRNTLIFDGLLAMASQTALGSYYKALATGTPGVGTPLTADGEGGVVELDDALQSLWDNYRLSPDEIWVSSQEQKSISKKILQGNSTSAQRFTFQVNQGTLAGGVMVRSYLNPFSMNGAVEIPIKLHPNMPPGTILMLTHKLPYPLSNVTNVMQMRLRRDYYQIEWPIRSRKYEYGVYADGVLQHYFPPSMAVITNIAKG